MNSININTGDKMKLKQKLEMQWSSINYCSIIIIKHITLKQAKNN